jgi:putative endopeptidase
MNPSIPPVRQTIDPGKDFYSYVNANWLQRASIPSFAGSYGVSEEIEERVRGALLKSILSLKKSKPDHPISLLTQSVINVQAQENNVRDLRHMLNSFSCMRSSEDVAREIGRLNRIQSRAPITFSVNSDTYKSSECRIHIYEPVLGLPAKHHYRSSTPNQVVLMYGSMLRKVGELLEVQNLDGIISIENAILPSLSEGETGQEIETYTSLSFNMLCSKYKHVPWEVMIASWGVPTDIIHKTSYIITNDRYIRTFNKLFKNNEIDAWRVWMQACLALSFLEYLPPPFDDLHYNLYGKKLRGNSQKLPQKLLMLRVLQTFAGQALARIFVQDHVTNSIKESATSMVKRLKSATVNRIRSIKWMNHNTKDIATKKVEAMRFLVAYPNVWYNEFNGLIMDPSRMLHNIISLCVLDTDKTIKTIGPGCGDLDGTWDDGAFDVNAYYYPDKNMLTVPAGMLRPPFFDPDRSAAWNYGGIGSAIGHEITHGFDADGKNYDLHGTYREWWSDKDNKIYDATTKSLIKLYDGQDYLGGKVNGLLTLSENIADIGGLAIALDALNSELRIIKADAKTQKKAYKDFFTSYAVSWRNKDRPRKARQALYLDVHAPAPLRVNLVVRQFAEFYEAFDISEDNPGWIPPNDRVLLW